MATKDTPKHSYLSNDPDEDDVVGPLAPTAAPELHEKRAAELARRRAARQARVLLPCEAPGPAAELTAQWRAWAAGHPDFEAWIQYGYAQGWCTPPVCATHDGTPTSAAEDDAVEAGGDPCLHVVRLTASTEEHAAVLANHSPSQWRKWW